MSVKSRKISVNVSKQELYYISRNLFKRNKSFMDENENEKEYIFTSPKRRNKSVIFSNKNHHFSTNSCSPIKPKYMRDLEQKNQENFERFFNTSANRINKQCEDEFAKSRERFLYSRDRSTTANTSFNLSSGFQQLQLQSSNSPFKHHHHNLNLSSSSALQQQQQQNNLLNSQQSQGGLINKSLSKLSQQQINLNDTLYGNNNNNVQLSQSEYNSKVFMNGYSPNNNNNNIRNLSGTKSSFIIEESPNKMKKNNIYYGSEEVNKQLQQEEEYLQVQQIMQQMEQQSNADEQWKNVRHTAPRYTFYKNSPRKTIIGPQSTLVLDDEKRYNNFSLKKPDEHHTLNMKNSTGRDYKVFKQYQMNDLIYSQSNQQYEKIIYDNKTLKCQFDLQKQESNENSNGNGVIGRQFYQKQHKHDIPATDLDTDKVIAAHNDLLPFKKNIIPQFHKMSARERPSSSPYRLLKYIENPYLHEDKSNKKINIQKCHDS